MTEFRFKEIDKTRNYFIEEIKQNKLISKKHKRICKILKYISHLLTLASSTVTRCVPISTLALLTGIPVDFPSYAIVINFFIMITGIKKYKPINKRKKKKHDKIVLLAKT